MAHCVVCERDWKPRVKNPKLCRFCKSVGWMGGEEAVEAEKRAYAERVLKGNVRPKK